MVTPLRFRVLTAIRFIQAFSILSTKSVLDSEFQQRVLQQQVTSLAAKNGLPPLPNITYCCSICYRGDLNACFHMNFFFKIKVEDKWICKGFAGIIRSSRIHSHEILLPVSSNCNLNMTFSATTCRDNFKIMFDPSDARSTVFSLLEEACIELMKISFTLKSQEGSQLGHRYVYYRMLWSEWNCLKFNGSEEKISLATEPRCVMWCYGWNVILGTSGFSCLKSYYNINSLLFVFPVTMACKCHVERGSRECIGYWNKYFTAVSGWAGVHYTPAIYLSCLD